MNFLKPILDYQGSTSPDDAIAIKIVAVAGYGKDFTAYYGPSDWSDEEVAHSGDKISEEAGRALFGFVFHERAWRG